jgi:hypothetical protein
VVRVSIFWGDRTTEVRTFLGSDGTYISTCQCFGSIGFVGTAISHDNTHARCKIIYTLGP